ncbi:hypothetical protein [Reichenbachiella ulvae]|uniref:Uncharacterized protein n=1 Tax=Reichenbachiella ulvae TaxID=2980104 RepID=A0ABT3CUT8_9BACT|nr:hypothetical protein [Reichenbachiella ulvae]MCV9387323.1 hypothetical protein [Reichenbachiella ulvae]
MTTYQERKKNETKFVLLENDTVLGVFGSLTRMCKFMEGKDFPSYSFLSKKKADRIDAKGYSIQKVRSY